MAAAMPSVATVPRAGIASARHQVQAMAANNGMCSRFCKAGGTSPRNVSVSGLSPGIDDNANDSTVSAMGAA